MEAGHPGDCYFYLSYDADFAEPKNFFKVWAVPGCGAPDGKAIPDVVTRTIKLPEELPACEHCVLRWEWTAHQQVNNIEYYVSCADVRIASDAPPTRPEPTVAIAGFEHLPAEPSAYRKATRWRHVPCNAARARPSLTAVPFAHVQRDPCAASRACADPMPCAD